MSRFLAWQLSLKQVMQDKHHIWRMGKLMRKLVLGPFFLKLRRVDVGSEFHQRDPGWK